MLTDEQVAELIERVAVLEANQRKFELVVRESLLSIVADIEKRHKVGKYKPVEANGNKKVIALPRG